MTKPELRAECVLSQIPGTRFDFGGLIGVRIGANQKHWLLTTPDANPAMLQMFRDRDRQPVRDLVPWAGEFAGKYLTSAILGYRVTHDDALREYVAGFVRELVSTQADDGYIGAFPRAYRLTGRTVGPDGTERSTWDAWNHYHCMLGLLLWHEETGDEVALAACRRAADLFCARFLDTGVRLGSTGSEEMNLAPIHALCLLYELTGVDRYLRMAREIEKDFETPPAGDYVRTALAGLEYWQTPKPRWESLHDIQGIAELYFITGDRRYRQAYEQIWWSIQRGDRHNNGGFSSGEQATGNPYNSAAIETCCTIAWSALSVDLLRMTGLSIAADEIELSTLNSVLGAQSPSGRWFTYNTPMDGVRKASHHDIRFQAREGSPELNCCSVNGPRGLGMLSDWAVMAAADGLVLNYYGPSTFTVPLPSGSMVRIAQETDYPLGFLVKIRVDPDRAENFAVQLRVPAWSAHTELQVNGRETQHPRPGAYVTIQRRWEQGDIVRLALDDSLRLWVGEREAEGQASIYRGPILLAYDPRFNEIDPDDLPAIDASQLVGWPIDPARTSRPHPALLVRFRAKDGRDLDLCDFASAGAAGNAYKTWLPMVNLEHAGVPPAHGAMGVDDSTLRPDGARP